MLVLTGSSCRWAAPGPPHRAPRRVPPATLRQHSRAAPAAQAVRGRWRSRCSGCPPRAGRVGWAPGPCSALPTTLQDQNSHTQAGSGGFVSSICTNYIPAFISPRSRSFPAECPVDIINISTAFFNILFSHSPKMHYQKHYLKRVCALTSAPSLFNQSSCRIFSCRRAVLRWVFRYTGAAGCGESIYLEEKTVQLKFEKPHA